MRPYEFKLPDIGEGIAEAEIVAWHVAVGDMVKEDAPLADMMTDKATVEISSPISGRIVELGGTVGDQVAIGGTLVTFAIEGDTQDGADTVPQLALAGTATDGRKDSADGDVCETDLAPVPIPEAHAIDGVVVSAPVAEVPPPATDKAVLVPVLASPAVRQRAKDLGIDLALVDTATGGRVRHGDLDAYLAYHPAYRPRGSQREDEQVRVVGLRRRIAENMAASKRSIPHFTYVEEIEVTKLEALREDFNASRGERPKLTILPLLIVALCRAAAEFPMINARYDDEAGVVTRSGPVHLGVATQTDAGLMVPVVRNAQDRNIWQLATEIRRLADGARSGKASSAELSGSTLTITSLGMLGGVATTPVINRPEVAIIGPNRVVERPVIKNDTIVIAKMMNLSISCDHRVVDGWDAARFVQYMKSLIETPARLFVD